MNYFKYTGLLAVFYFFELSNLSFSLDFSKDDTVVECHLTKEIQNVINSHPIEQDFEIAFNELKKTVTYVAGPAVTVEDTSDFAARWNVQIVFQGRSLKFDDVFTRYLGAIDRLTGKINLTKTRVFDDQNKNTSLQYLGTCETHNRRF